MLQHLLDAMVIRAMALDATVLDAMVLKAMALGATAFKHSDQLQHQPGFLRALGSLKPLTLLLLIPLPYPIASQHNACNSSWDASQPSWEERGCGDWGSVVTNPAGLAQHPPSLCADDRSNYLLLQSII